MEELTKEEIQTTFNRDFEEIVKEAMENVEMEYDEYE